MHRAFYSALPIGIELIPLVSAHLRLEGAINCPMLAYFLVAAPEAGRHASKIRSTQGSRRSNLWPLHRHSQNISLELHEQVIDDGASIDTQSRHMHATISGHGLKHITGLITHGLKGCTSNVASGRTPCQSPDRAACVGIPVRSSQADKGRDEEHTTIIRAGCS